MNQSHIRNFAIIAHIDHGKSTLADRLLELTHTVEARDMEAQILDSNPIERERGITIKLAPVRMKYSSNVIPTYVGIQNRSFTTQKRSMLTLDPRFRGDDKKEVGDDKKEYILNLIDTPGHVDFAYEVSRSLAACEGAILVVDATQGIQAQTLANLTQARNHQLTIIPVINKIDMPGAAIEETKQELKGIGFTEEEMILISAKTGENVEAVLEAIVSRIPPPQGNPDRPLRALIFSSQYDTHKGVVVFVRVVDGPIGQLGEKTEGYAVNKLRLQFMLSGSEVNPVELGYFMPKMLSTAGLSTGEVGYIATGLKDIRYAKVGDTVTVLGDGISVMGKEKAFAKSNLLPLPGYKEPKSMVLLGLFPISSDEIEEAREAMEKLRLSDSASTFRPISSLALGNGFHCGFLGLLHAEVVQERLLREFELTMLATAPSVEYLIKLRDGVNPSRAGMHNTNMVTSPVTSAISPVIPAKAGIQSPHTSLLNGEIPSLDSRLSIRRAQDPECIEGHGNDKKENSDIYYSIQSAAEFPDPSVIAEVKEPIMQLSVFTPRKYVGGIMTLCQEKRAEYIDLVYHGEPSLFEASTFAKASADETAGNASHGLAKFTYLMPLSEMIVDFFDRMKSVSEGYASLDYEFFDYQSVEVVKLDILVNKEKVDAFSTLVVKDQAIRQGKVLVERLAGAIPKQQFEIPVQAATGGQVIARADVKAFRKDVIAKLYGGDRTRKDKLLDKQKKGKAKMKMVGRVEIPQSAFFAVLKRE